MNSLLRKVALIFLVLTALAVPAAFAAQPAPKPLKVGPGVSAKTITVGSLMDFTGPFAAAGKLVDAGIQTFWKGQNARGGVCNRQVVVLSVNHGYNPQTALAVYKDMQPNILFVNGVLGSPVISALLPSLTQDHVLAVQVGWTSFALSSQYAIITGATYDVDMINAVQYLVSRKGLKQGDKIGHIFFVGDFGENALLGSKYATDKLGLGLVEQKIAPTVADVSAQVSAFRSQGVKAILASVAPGQVVSLANSIKAQGLDVPVIVNAPGWSPALLTGPAAGTIASNFYFLDPEVSPGQNTTMAKRALTEFHKYFPGQPDSPQLIDGYLKGLVAYNALSLACARRDLTRDGMVRAFHSLSNLKTGLAPPLHFQTHRKTGTYTYVQRADPSAIGGIKTVFGLKSNLVDAYKIP